MLAHITYQYEYPTKLRAGFIGCGGHAIRNIYPTFQYAPVDLVAVCDMDAERAKACGKLFGAERSYTDHHEMLSRENLDVVFVVTNLDERSQPRYPKLAIDCLQAGAHAWIEKPPAGTSQEILGMMEASRQTGRHVGVGFKKMFFPANLKARHILQQPGFGRVTSITARYPQVLPPESARSDAGCMAGFLDHIVHPHSLLLLLGGAMDSLRVERNDVAGSAIVSLRFTSGAIGSLHLSAGQGGSSFLERTEIVGEGESLVVDNNIRVHHYRRAQQPGLYGRTGDSFAEFGAEDATLSWEPDFSLGQLYNKGIFLLGYAPEIIHFTQRILDGKAPEQGTLADALEILSIYEAYLRPDGVERKIGRQESTRGAETLIS